MAARRSIVADCSELDPEPLTLAFRPYADSLLSGSLFSIPFFLGSVLRTRICWRIFRRWPPKSYKNSDTLTIFFFIFILLVSEFGHSIQVCEASEVISIILLLQSSYYCFNWWNYHVDLKLCRLFACISYFLFPFLARM